MNRQQGRRIIHRCISEKKPTKSLIFAKNRLDLSALHSQQIQALANLLPLLICGEESASYVFDALANTLAGQLDTALILDLRSITQDEIRHAVYLEHLRASLPTPADRHSAHRAAVFLSKLNTPVPVRQLARLAALDSAVCKLLAALLHPAAPISKCAPLAAMLRRIQLDEARHVRITRACVRVLNLSPEQVAAEQAVVLQAFLTLLQASQADLYTLQIDIDALLRCWLKKPISAPGLQAPGLLLVKMAA
jgi:hypothetical protein